MVVGPQVRQSLIDGGVELGGHQRVLEPGTVRGVVVDVVGGDDLGAGFGGDPGQLAVAVGVAGQEVLLKLDVHRVGPVPVEVLLQQAVGLTGALVDRQPRERPVAPAGQQNHAFAVIGQVGRVELGFPAVAGIGQGEKARDVGVPRPCLRQQGEPRAIGQRQLCAGDGLGAQALGQPGELQRAAQVGIGQGQRRIAVLLGLRQQLVDMRRPLPEGVEALGSKLHPGSHQKPVVSSSPLVVPIRVRCQALCRYQRWSTQSRNRVISLPSPGSIR